VLGMVYEYVNPYAFPKILHYMFCATFLSYLLSALVLLFFLFLVLFFF
jgi:hypothetical protein